MISLGQPPSIQNIHRFGGYLCVGWCQFCGNELFTLVMTTCLTFFSSIFCVKDETWSLLKHNMKEIFLSVCVHPTELR